MSSTKKIAHIEIFFSHVNQFSLFVFQYCDKYFRLGTIVLGCILLLENCLFIHRKAEISCMLFKGTEVGQT